MQNFQNYFGKDTYEKMKSVLSEKELEYVQKYFNSMDNKVEKQSLEFFDLVEEFGAFYTKRTPDECISYIYDYFKRFGYLLPKQNKNALSIMEKLSPKSYL